MDVVFQTTYLSYEDLLAFQAAVLVPWDANLLTSAGRALRTRTGQAAALFGVVEGSLFSAELDVSASRSVYDT